MRLNKRIVIGTATHAYCDCGGEFLSNFICENVEKHFHECNKCGKIEWLDKVYPIIETEEVPVHKAQDIVTPRELKEEPICCPHCDAEQDIGVDHKTVILLKGEPSIMVCQKCGKRFYVEAKNWVDFDTYGVLSD
jgi:transcription elongation factor Elf1